VKNATNFNIYIGKELKKKITRTRIMCYDKTDGLLDVCFGASGVAVLVCRRFALSPF